MKPAFRRRHSCSLILATLAAALVATALSGQTDRLPKVVASANHTLIILPSGAVKVFARSNEAGQLGLGVVGWNDWDHHSSGMAESEKTETERCKFHNSQIVASSSRAPATSLDQYDDPPTIDKQSLPLLMSGCLLIR
jgi:hypothetical protein